MAAALTPPIGMNVFVISGMSREVSIQGVFLGTAPFLVAMGVLLALLMLFQIGRAHV